MFIHPLESRQRRGLCIFLTCQGTYTLSSQRFLLLSPDCFQCSPMISSLQTQAHYLLSECISLTYFHYGHLEYQTLEPRFLSFSTQNLSIRITNMVLQTIFQFLSYLIDQSIHYAYPPMLSIPMNALQFIVRTMTIIKAKVTKLRIEIKKGLVIFARRFLMPIEITSSEMAGDYDGGINGCVEP